MAKHASYTEILKMTPDEIGREIREHELSVAKQRLQVQLGSHKDTAAFRAERRQVARLKTAMNQKQEVVPAAVEAPKKTTKKVLKKTDSDSTLSAPASA
ncbi:MAG: 50S ribosomal protein L29 [Candidatus Peribacteraceae bacterium]|nr:50S ribosomal protein L29 [Candidatus Peribacteraceae bacterium]